MSDIIAFQTPGTILASPKSASLACSSRRSSPSATAVYPTRTGTRPLTKASPKQGTKHRSPVTTIPQRKAPTPDPRAQEAAMVLAEYEAFLTSPAAAGVDIGRTVYLIHNNTLVCQYP